MAESPRSVNIFNKLTAQMGRPLTFYDISDYLSAVESSIEPSEVLQDMALDLKSVIDRFKSEYCIDVRPEMTVGQIFQLL